MVGTNLESIADTELEARLYHLGGRERILINHSRQHQTFTNLFILKFRGFTFQFTALKYQDG